MKFLSAEWRKLAIISYEVKNYGQKFFFVEHCYTSFAECSQKVQQSKYTCKYQIATS